jgi:hypothetical protein
MVIDVDLDAAPATLRLVEPDDFTSFKLLARSAQANGDELARAVRSIGRVSGSGHVFVNADAVRALARDRARDPAWLRSLDGMIRYARDHGWTDDTGAIRAHIYWGA